MSGRTLERIELVEAYSKIQGMWREGDGSDLVFTDTLELELGDVVPSMAGPKRPEGRIALENIASGFAGSLDTEYKKPGQLDVRYRSRHGFRSRSWRRGDCRDHLGHQHVQPLGSDRCRPARPQRRGQGLDVEAMGQDLARTWIAGRRRISRPPPACRPTSTRSASTWSVSAAHLHRQFGPLPAPISKTINDKGLITAGVLSGNRNFEGRISPVVQANYLASPPLVVAYALAGSVQKDLTTEPLGIGTDGQPVFLKDIWPTSHEIQEFILKYVTRELYESKYADVFKGDANWQAVQVPPARPMPGRMNRPMFRTHRTSWAWARPALASRTSTAPRVLGLFGDKITTDHISPAGSIKAASPAGAYLTEHASALPTSTSTARVAAIMK